MPLYEYRCSKCGSVFEVIQKFSDPPLSKHEACGGEVERLLSAPALQFKGSGWYVTDYARAGSEKKPEAQSEAKSDAKSDAKAEASGDKAESKAGPKPAAKPDTASSTPAAPASKSKD